VQVVQRKLRDQTLALVHLVGMQVSENLLVVLFSKENHLSHKSDDVILLLCEEV
jgi:hypothetical protein